VARSLLLTLCLAGASFVACQVYDASLLGEASGLAGRGTGGSGATSGVGGSSTAGSGVGGSNSGGGSSGGASSGGTGDGGTSILDAGAGGEAGETSGGTAGTGGSVAGAGGTGGASGGVAGAGGASGKGGGAGSGGKAGSAGSAGVGGGGAGSGGAGAGGAGTGGAGTSGAAGSGGSGRTVVELMGTATADSEEATTSQMHPATHGNDGNATTRWCAANGNANHYWTVDLGAVHEVTRVEVTWEYPPAAAGLPYRYRIDISSNGTTFTPSIDKTANMEVTSTQTVSFPASTMARHVRIVVTGLPTGAWASFFEASVFGY
jgi:hypothetical protein